MQQNTETKKQLLSLEDFCEEYSLSKTRFYSEVKKKKLQPIKLGNRTFIAREDAQAWLNKLREEAQIHKKSAK